MTRKGSKVQVLYGIPDFVEYTQVPQACPDASSAGNPIRDGLYNVRELSD